jgi:nitrate reductase NapE component
MTSPHRVRQNAEGEAAQMADRTDSAIAPAQSRSQEMDPDVFLTIAFVLYAVITAAVVGLLIVRSERDTAVDQAVEKRLAGSTSTARPAAERVRPLSGRHGPAPWG